MKVWRKRRFSNDADIAPLTPAQVAAMRERSDRIQSLIVSAYLGSAAVGSLVLAVLFTTGAGPGHHGLVAWCFAQGAVLFVALGYALTGKELGAVIVALAASYATIMVIVSQVSAGLSMESFLFGLAVMAFVLVRSDRPVLRVALAAGAIGAYIACELVWPDGSGAAQLPDDLAHQVAIFDKVGAGVLLLGAVVLLEMRHTMMNRVLAGAARYGELRATTDELTGVYNRRPVIAQLAEWNKRGRGNYAIALIDLDHFKTINDEFGHDCGDTTIQAVAATLRAHFRDSDMVSRWGGDEFLVLMPGIRHADLVPVLERLRRAVNLIERRCADHVHTVSVSIGAAMGATGQSPDECIAAADHALYRAKEEGRNRVVAVGTAAPTTALGRPDPGEPARWSPLSALRERH